jgi:hypothetical protein
VHTERLLAREYVLRTNLELEAGEDSNDPALLWQAVVMAYVLPSFIVEMVATAPAKPAPAAPDSHRARGIVRPQWNIWSPDHCVRTMPLQQKTP